MCTARTQIYTHVKDPISICYKRVGITANGVETQKHCTQGKGGSWVVPYYTMAAHFPWEKQPEFPVGQESYLT